MESAVLVVLAIVVALVAIDALGRLDERRPKSKPKKDQTVISTQKIVVDLSKRS
ncbi:MAG TPA: hypothetical protein VMZ53_22745 [Kofleriaceae bacterium]|nr:hypothetical protein [Kofleriaceae bacterium]